MNILLIDSSASHRRLLESIFVADTINAPPVGAFFFDQLHELDEQQRCLSNADCIIVSLDLLGWPREATYSGLVALTSLRNCGLCQAPAVVVGDELPPQFRFPSSAAVRPAARELPLWRLSFTDSSLHRRHLMENLGIVAAFTWDGLRANPTALRHLAQCLPAG